jgi:hypothetical protein
MRFLVSHEMGCSTAGMVLHQTYAEAQTDQYSDGRLFRDLLILAGVSFTPVDQLEFLKRYWLIRQPQHRAPAISPPRCAQQILLRLRACYFADTADLGQSLRCGEIFRQIVTRLVNFGVDRVYCQVPLLYKGLTGIQLRR